VTASLDDAARTLLVGVDGRTSARSLANASPLGERRALAVLHQLEQQGFVERKSNEGPEPRAAVVCQDEARLALMRLTLSRMGFWSVSIVPDADAVPTLTAIEPDVLIVDDHRGDGLDWLKAMRRARVGRRVPVVVVSADANRIGWWRRSRLGIRGVVPRPFDDVRLSRVVRAASDAAHR